MHKVIGIRFREMGRKRLPKTPVIKAIGKSRACMNRLGPSLQT